MCYNTFKNINPSYISLACNIFSVTIETPEQTSLMSKQNLHLGLTTGLLLVKQYTSLVYSGYVI